jgi:hypothetical protein
MEPRSFLISWSFSCSQILNGILAISDVPDPQALLREKQHNRDLTRTEKAFTDLDTAES